MQGVIRKLRVMVSAGQRKEYMTQCGNRECVSLIECISITGQVLRSWVILKAVLEWKAGLEDFPEAHISTSEKGWTENEIYLQWIERCFWKETSATQKGEYGMLCVDGHASHISTIALASCVAHKIIVLCLPPHTTHLLQPLFYRRTSRCRRLGLMSLLRRWWRWWGLVDLSLYLTPKHWCRASLSSSMRGLHTDSTEMRWERVRNTV